MQFDPDNKVVQLCIQGMNAEGEGKTTEARNLFQQAWNSATNDFEAFTAAHYLARQQDNPGDTLRWNLSALSYAKTIDDESMKSHYPSLYLNIAKSYEAMGDNNKAAKYYQQAAEQCGNLPPGKYGETIRFGISEGLRRTNFISSYPDIIGNLVNNWCDRRELKPLAIILPAYLGNLGSENDLNRLTSALHYLSATKCLNAEEQRIIEQLISTSNEKE